MNNIQKVIAVAAMLSVALAIIFPPWINHLNGSHDGFRFINSGGHNKDGWACSVNVGLLSIEVVGIIFIGAMAVLISQSRRR